MENKIIRDIPTAKQLEAEMKRLRYKQNMRHSVFSTISALLVIASLSIIISTMLLPILRVTGTSMTPTLNNGEYVICSKISDIKHGDIVAFYYNNKVLIKRVIGTPGDIINISEDGTVNINDETTDEPYLSEKAVGECDIDLPYQVPENRLFVMGDHRAVSIDSRSTSVGCIADENVIGKVVLRIYPFDLFGTVK